MCEFSNKQDKTVKETLPMAEFAEVLYSASHIQKVTAFQIVLLVFLCGTQSFHSLCGAGTCTLDL